MGVIKDVYSLFESLPPDSAEWNELDRLVDSLKALREEKLRQLNGAQQEQIAKTLAEFILHHGGVISALNLHVMCTWQPLEGDGEELLALGKDVESFLSRLTAYDQHLDRMDRATKSERARISRELVQLEDEVIPQFARISSMMVASPVAVTLPLDSEADEKPELKNSPDQAIPAQLLDDAGATELQAGADLSQAAPTQKAVVETESLVDMATGQSAAKAVESTMITPDSQELGLVGGQEGEVATTGKVSGPVENLEYIGIFDIDDGFTSNTLAELADPPVVLPLTPSTPEPARQPAQTPEMSGLVLMRSKLIQRTPLNPPEEAVLPDEEINRLLRDRPELLEPRQIEETLWRYVKEDHLPEALWLSQVLETTGAPGEGSLPTWLIKAWYAAEWLRVSWPVINENLLNEINEQLFYAPLPDTLLQSGQWLSLAGALLPALLSPQLSSRACLPSDGLPAVAALAQRVQQFCENNHNPNLFGQLSEYLLCERGLRDAQKKAVEWHAYGPSRRTAYDAASAVWIELTGAREPIGRMMGLVAFNRPKGESDSFPEVDIIDPTTWTTETGCKAVRARVSELKDILTVWADPRKANTEIQKRNEIITRARKLQAAEIVDPVLGNLLEFVDEACQIARLWMEAAEIILKRQDDLWDLDERLEWMHAMRGCLNAASAELKEALWSEMEPANRASLACLRRAVYLLREPFALEYADPPEDLLLAPFLQPGMPRLEDVSIEKLLAGVPVRYPEVKLTDNGEPEADEANLYLLASLLAREPHRSVSLAVKGWSASHDYRFINQLIDRYDLDEGERRDLLDFTRKHSGYDLRQLKRALDVAQQEIEQAMLDDLISEDERSHFIAIHSELNDSVQAAEQAFAQGKYSQNITLLIERVETQIMTPIQSFREAVLNQRRKDWPAQWEQLDNRVKLGTLSEDQFHEAALEMEDNLQKGVLRRINELSGAISRYLNNQGNFSEVLVRPQPPRDFLGNYLSYRTAITRRTLDLFINHVSDICLEDGRQFTSPVNMRQVLMAWNNLYDFEEDPGQVLKNVETLALYLFSGFISKRPKVVDASSELSEALKINVVSWRIEVNPHNVVPIPQVGSSMQTPFTYYLIGVWQTYGNDIANILRSLKSKTPYILFYFGTLTESQQNTIRQIAVKRDLHALVLDQPLLIYLGFESQARLQAFLECTLPYTAINPFMGRKGDTHPEMFFGRDNERTRLEDPNGPASIYGGRWIGKTALLYDIIRRNHHPDQKTFAVLVDLLDISPNGRYHLSFWNRFAAALEKQKLISLDTRNSVPIDDLIELLYKEIHNRGLRVLALFDEADQFLASDAGYNFQVVLRLLQLSQRTGWNFKAVFSGVHNVQGFSRIPNQPLAQLGTSVELGPLDPQPALELLRNPLHALGYRFDNIGGGGEGLLLYALSYTNYHPALIQSFGRWLVEHLRQRSETFPCVITRQDIESVARRREVREEIRDRFKATLKLDNRYYCITLYMILNQWNRNNGFKESYCASDIHEAMQAIWPRGFETVDQAAVELLLQEMRGLGILSVDDNGSYYLRSPNIIGLVGTPGQLEADMAAIQDTEPLEPSRVESCHQAFAPEMREYSPLTNQQITTLFPSRSGIGLVFGSDALGIDSMAAVVEDTACPAITITGKRAAWAKANIQARSGSALKEWLQDFIDSSGNVEQVYIFRRLEGTPVEMCEQVEAAFTVCRRISKPVVRVIFAINAQSAWEWFQLPNEMRRKYDEMAAPALWLRRWDLVAIQQRLERVHPENTAKKEWYEKVYEVTGGWHLLVEDFFEEYQKTDPETAKNVLEMAERFRKSMAEPGSESRKRFFDALGLYDRQLKYVLHRFINEKDGVPLEEWAELLFSAEWSEDRAVLGDNVCETAALCADYLEKMGLLERTIVGKHNQVILVADPLVASLWSNER